MTVKKLDITANGEAIILVMAVARLRQSVVKLRRNWDPLNESMLRQVGSLDLVYHLLSMKKFHFFTFLSVSRGVCSIVVGSLGLEYLASNSSRSMSCSAFNFKLYNEARIRG